MESDQKAGYESPDRRRLLASSQTHFALNRTDGKPTATVHHQSSLICSLGSKMKKQSTYIQSKQRPSIAYLNSNSISQSKQGSPLRRALRQESPFNFNFEKISQENASDQPDDDFSSSGDSCLQVSTLRPSECPDSSNKQDSISQAQIRQLKSITNSSLKKPKGAYLSPSPYKKNQKSNNEPPNKFEFKEANINNKEQLRGKPGAVNATEDENTRPASPVITISMQSLMTSHPKALTLKSQTASKPKSRISKAAFANSLSMKNYNDALSK